MKTIEKAAKEYASNLSSSEVFMRQHDKDFQAGVEFSQRWIPIEEDKPEEEFGFYKPVLVLVEKYGMCCSAAYKNGRFIPDNPVVDADEITHWRPIERT